MFFKIIHYRFDFKFELAFSIELTGVLNVFKLFKALQSLKSFRKFIH